VQLIDAATDTHLWAESYDRQLTAENLFDIQRQIAISIAEALQATLSPEEQERLKKVPTENLAALEAYLRGRFLVAQRTRAGVQGAVREFEKAISLDPNYASAHAELGLATLFLAYSPFGNLSVTEAINRALPSVEQALILDPNLAQAHAAKGFLLWRQGNFDDAQARYRRAIEIDPNYADAYNWLAILLDGLGRYDESFVAFETAAQLDPMSIGGKNGYAQGLIRRNRLAEADEVLEKLALIAPGFYAYARGLRTSLGGQWANWLLGSLDWLLVDPEMKDPRVPLALGLAILGVEYEALLFGPPGFVECTQRCGLGTDVLRVLGKYGDAVTAAEASVAAHPDSFAARRQLGMVLAGAGFDARALPILEEMWQENGRQIFWNSAFDISAAAALIHARRSTGDESSVSELVEAIRVHVRRYRKAGMTVAAWDFSADYEEGLGYFLSGERETGLALIRKGADEGFFIPLNEAYLEVLYDDPGFAQIEERQSARQARERDRFLAIVCTDNPYAAVWQPAERTCERIAAAGGN
jgi:tetratricopeptide (TPR) repeat protein